MEQVLFILMTVLFQFNANADEITCYEHSIELGPSMQRILFEAGNGLQMQVSAHESVGFDVRTVNGVALSQKLVCLDYSTVKSFEGIVQSANSWPSIHGRHFKLDFHESSATLVIADSAPKTFKICRAKRPFSGTKCY